MAVRKNNPSPGAELKRLLRDFSDTQLVEFLIADVNGVLRGKRVPLRDVGKCVTQGFEMPGSTVLLDTLGDVIDGSSWSADDGDPDVTAKLVGGSLAPVPWAKRPTAQALFRLFEVSGQPFVADPRSVLEQSLAPLKKRSLRIVMAAELEFYLLEAKAAVPTPRTSRVPGTGRAQPGPQVYNTDDLADVDDFLNELHDICAAQSIPAGATTSEFSPGQFEINLQHVENPVLACDHAVLLKRAVKALARRHGFVACFMAKPFAELSGSGLHIHLSLYAGDGKNYFSRGSDHLARPPYSARLRHAVGGLRNTMAESTALFAPNANSYRRLRADSFAPVEPNWGSNHRNVALRIPLCSADNLRIEHRAAGADANPYLVTAAILAGIEYGLKNRCDPGPMVAEGQSLKRKRGIPDRWNVALDKLARGKVLPDHLGRPFVNAYLANRRQEERRFHNAISNLDYDWYLRAV